MRRMLITLLLFAVPAMALAGPSIVGSMNGWDPASVDWELSLMPSTQCYFLTTTMAAGQYEYKVTETDTWDGNDFPGGNIMIDLAVDTEVTFFVNLGATVGVKEGDEYVTHDVPVIAGSFINEWGGADWDPADPAGRMVHIGGDLFELGGVLSANHHECKVTLNGTWDQDTGPNFAFDLSGSVYVNFVYEFGTNTLLEGDPIPTRESSLSQIKSLY